MKHILPIILLTASSLTTPAVAAETSLQLVINLTGDAERRFVKYECEGEDEHRIVEYLNASPNFLAITEIDGKSLIFANVISASGARYAAGQYVWSTKGSEASLFDETAGADAAPITTCLEVSDTP